jgi:hypothetical protein
MIGRSEAFGQGQSGNSTMVSSSLQQDSANFNDRVGKTFTPQSVLNSTVGSGNGMSTSDYSSRMLTNGGLLPTGNGESSDTQKALDKILLDGKQAVGTL